MLADDAPLPPASLPPGVAGVADGNLGTHQVAAKKGDFSLADGGALTLRDDRTEYAGGVLPEGLTLEDYVRTNSKEQPRVPGEDG